MFRATLGRVEGVWGDVDEEEATRFDSFATSRGPRLLRLATALCGDPHGAEDLVQEALARTYLSWARVTSADNPDAYARQILVNAFRSSMRRRRVREVLFDRPPERVAVDPFEAIVGRPEVLTALRSVPTGMRAVVVLRYLEDLSEQEVAALLGVSLGTVKSQGSKGLARLRVLLERPMEVSS